MTHTRTLAHAHRDFLPLGLGGGGRGRGPRGTAQPASSVGKWRPTLHTLVQGMPKNKAGNTGAEKHRAEPAHGAVRKLLAPASEDQAPHRQGPGADRD